MNKLTVDQAGKAVGELTGDAAKVASLIAACLNAEAAFHMLGCKAPKRRTGFLPVGVQTLVEIEDLLATMPDEVALVSASMAFPCEYCGMPAETGGGDGNDGWICDACCEKSRHSPDAPSADPGQASDPATQSADPPPVL